MSRAILERNSADPIRISYPTYFTLDNASALVPTIEAARHQGPGGRGALEAAGEFTAGLREWL